jgi:hypothetical protein
VNTEANASQAAKPVAYVLSRERALNRTRPSADLSSEQDLFVVNFLRKVFLPRFAASRDWRELFRTERDAAAFLQDLRNCGWVCFQAVGLVEDDPAAVKTINGLIADAIEREPTPDDGELEHSAAII